MSDQNNKLIADFIGLERNDQGYLNDHNSMDYLAGFPSWDYGRLPLEQLRFDVDWNWLMYVVNFIGDKTGYELIMYYSSSYWNQFGDNPIGVEYGGYQHISGIYEAVVEFIKWYNTQNQ